MSQFPTLKFFHYAHLPPHLRAISKPFHDLAVDLASREGVDGRETAAGLRKLLEAKDCFVRAQLSPAPCHECNAKASFDRVANKTIYNHSESCSLRAPKDPPIIHTGNHA